MRRAEEVRTAIQRHDSATLRRMADEALRSEDPTFLLLLAQLVEQRPEPIAHDDNVTAAMRTKHLPNGDRAW